MTTPSGTTRFKNGGVPGETSRARTTLESRLQTFSGLRKASRTCRWGPAGRQARTFRRPTRPPAGFATCNTMLVQLRLLEQASLGPLHLGLHESEMTHWLRGLVPRWLARWGPPDGAATEPCRRPLSRQRPRLLMFPSIAARARPLHVLCSSYQQC
jgi:hypothetical protein